MTYPGKTTAEDWDHRVWAFWRTWDRGKATGIARTRDAAALDDEGYRFCEEHTDWELARTRISSLQALALVESGATDTDDVAHPEGETP